MEQVYSAEMLSTSQLTPNDIGQVALPTVKKLHDKCAKEATTPDLLATYTGLMQKEGYYFADSKDYQVTMYFGCMGYMFNQITNRYADKFGTGEKL